jgi:hypothetical protein
MPQLPRPTHVPGHRSSKSEPVTPSDHQYEEDSWKAIRASLPPLPNKPADEAAVDESDKETIRNSVPSPEWSLCLSEGYIKAVRSRLGCLLFDQFVTVTKKYELNA